MGVQGLEAQLLREVVAEERGELEEAKERLLLSLAADTRQLQDLQDRILKLLKVTTPIPVSLYLREHIRTCVGVTINMPPDLCLQNCLSPDLCHHIFA